MPFLGGHVKGGRKIKQRLHANNFWMENGRHIVCMENGRRGHISVIDRSQNENIKGKKQR